MKKDENYILDIDEDDPIRLVEEKLRQDKNVTIIDFGTFSIDNSSREGKTIVFTPSENLLERLDSGPECPKCHSRNVVNFDEDFGAYFCEECETEWEEQI